ncbi:hypothetical protein GYMLUDRAFT_46216 [Collybiopsis luxurians FD-317 M1]|uniref:Uncharacterized protein n=1 Tax=Collybiopsis luxurians FD-317 M1 TaxID=944289 RepID=A0A0D0BQE5_9AGAR|nr:hypothetical protein GYMLUDRAFT_46216 [Collybiopsis luxurians FD-317 M1]
MAHSSPTSSAGPSTRSIKRNLDNDPPFSADLSYKPSGDPTVRKLPVDLPGQSISLDDPPRVHDFLCRELSVPRLNEVHRHLWIAGWNESIHPLHWHIMVRRQIVVTEDPNMHLVCTDWAIFIKPLPICLLDYDFYLCFISKHDSLSQAARGLLRSYARLVVHESDFLLAQQYFLLPRGMKWLDWTRLAEQLALIPTASVNKRYRLGELRLSRLNLVYRIWKGRLMYFRMHRSYTAYFSEQYRSSLILFAYTTVIHAALQTILTTGSDWWGVKLLARMSLWFGTLTVILVLTSVLFQTLYLLTVFLYNLQATLRVPRQFKLE